MRKISKIIFMVIMVLLITISFSFIGCKVEEAPAVVEEAPEVEEEAPAVEEVAPAEQVVLNSMFLGATWGTATQELALEYEQETGVKVNVELVGRDQIYTKLALAATGGAEYDIFNIDYSWIPQFGENGWLYPLGEFADKYEVNLDEYLPLALATTQWNGNNGEFGQGGELYGLPQTIHHHLVWYRGDLFADQTNMADFEAEFGRELTVPETWEEFGEVASFFHGRDDGAGNTLSGWAAQATQTYGNVHTLLTFIYGYGGDVFNWDTMEPTFNSPEVIEGTKVWADLLQYCPPGINDYTFAEDSSDAAQDRIAMAIHWSWSAWEVDNPDASTTVGLWEFAPVPKGTVSAPHLAAWPVVIPKASVNAEEAFKFIAWLENAENDVRQADMGGGDPIRIASYSDPILADQVIEGTDIKKYRRYEALANAMANTKARPWFPGEEELEVIISPILTSIQTGAMSVEDALADIDEAVAAMLAE